MLSDEVIRRSAHFGREHLAWIVVRHFLSADLLAELSQAIVAAASNGQLDLLALFDTVRSEGPPTLTSWAVRPRQTASAFEQFLQHLIRQLVWQGDQAVGYLEQGKGIGPNEAAAMKSLDDAMRASWVDLKTAASLSRFTETAPKPLQLILSVILDLGKLPPRADREALEKLMRDCMENFESPLGVVLVKHLGDLCADADRWEAAALLYGHAEEVLASTTDPAWAELTLALRNMTAQSRAAAQRNLEGPAAAVATLDGLISKGTLASNPLAFLNATLDAMNARSAPDRLFLERDTRSAVILAPQLLDTHQLTNAYDCWLDKDYTQAHRWFWATLRRQTALGSASYSRHTKAAYGRSLIDAARDQLRQEREPRLFELGVRLLLESGQPKAVDQTSWTEQLIQRYVDAGRIQSTVVHSRRAPGALRERTMVTLVLFKHWVQALPPDAGPLAEMMLSVLCTAAREDDHSTPTNHDLADAALEGLAAIAATRPEFRSLVANEVAEAVIVRIRDGGMLTLQKALELANDFLESLNDQSLERVVNATLELLDRFKPSLGPWPVVRPAMALLGSKRVLSVCQPDGPFGSRVPTVLLKYGLESETEHANLMYLLRDLDPSWIQEKVDNSKVLQVISELRRRATTINSSRAADDILALLVAPMFSGADGVRDALAALLSILFSAANGKPSISFARAYHPLMLIGETRQTLASEAKMPDDELTAILNQILGALLKVWEKALQTPLIFAGFAIPPRTTPNTAIIHNWAFASVGFAKSLGREQEMAVVLDAAGREPLLEVPISVARAIRVVPGDIEIFDIEAIRGEKREAFYSALGHRLVLLSGLPDSARARVVGILLEQCFRLGPRGLDAGVFAVASSLQPPLNASLTDAESYRRRLDNDSELRLSLAPMFDSLTSTGTTLVD